MHTAPSSYSYTPNLMPSSKPLFVRNLVRALAVLFSVSIATALILHEHRKAQPVADSAPTKSKEAIEAPTGLPPDSLTDSTLEDFEDALKDPVEEPQQHFLFSSKSGMTSTLLPPLDGGDIMIETSPPLGSSKSLGVGTELLVPTLEAVLQEDESKSDLPNRENPKR